MMSVPENDFKTAAAGDAVDCGDDGLVEVARVVESAESAHALAGGTHDDGIDIDFQQRGDMRGRVIAHGHYGIDQGRHVAGQFPTIARQ